MIDPTHIFDDAGLCRGCSMRRHWPGALAPCPQRFNTGPKAALRRVESRRRKRQLARVSSRASSTT